MASPATEVGPAGAQSKRGKKPAKGRITPPVSRRGASPDLKSPRHKVLSKAEAAAARKKETRKKEEETAAVAASSAAAMRVRMAAEQEKKETARLLEIAATHSNSLTGSEDQDEEGAKSQLFYLYQQQAYANAAMLLGRERAEQVCGDGYVGSPVWHNSRNPIANVTLEERPHARREGSPRPPLHLLCFHSLIERPPTDRSPTAFASPSLCVGYNTYTSYTYTSSPHRRRLSSTPLRMT